MSNFYDEGKKIKGQWEYLDISFLKPTENTERHHIVPYFDNVDDLRFHKSHLCLQVG